MYVDLITLLPPPATTTVDETNLRIKSQQPLNLLTIGSKLGPRTKKHTQPIQQGMRSLLNTTALSKRLTGNFAGRQSTILTFNFE